MVGGAAADAGIGDAEEAAVLAAMNGKALGELLALVAAETGAEAASLCVGGGRLTWSAGSDHAGRGLQQGACRMDCPLLAGAATRPGHRAIALASGEAGLGPRLCLSGTPRPPETPRVLAVLAAQAATQVTFSQRLAEAAVLAFETDHRVRNALQSIASFLRLQETQATDPDVRLTLAAAGRQIRAVSLLHDEIGRTSGHGTVRLDHYLDRLARHLAAVAPEGIRLVVDMPAAEIAADRAAALAIIVNEFVTNSAKHAFADGVGTVRVEGRITRPGELALTLADDGRGLAAPGRSGGLGLRIVEAAARKLGARQDAVAADDGGCRLALTFPVGLAEAA